MFVDASAIVAILNQETGYEEFVNRIEEGDVARSVSPLVRFEAATGLARSRSGEVKPTSEQLEEAERIVAEFCESIGARDITVTPDIGRLALWIARNYGKYVGHEAKLNFGDCFAYACASSRGVQLIHKGNDSAQTDLA